MAPLHLNNMPWTLPYRLRRTPPLAYMTAITTLYVPYGVGFIMMPAHIRLIGMAVMIKAYCYPMAIIRLMCSLIIVLLSGRQPLAILPETTAAKPFIYLWTL